MVIPGLNSEVLKRIVSTLGLQTMIDKTAMDLVPTIQPVIVANPERIADVVEKNSGTGAIYTTPTDKDFFLTNVNISTISQNQSGNHQDSISVVMESGATKTILGVGNGSGVATDNTANATLNLCVPVKLKRGSAITPTKISSSGSFSIIGFTRETL